MKRKKPSPKAEPPRRAEPSPAEAVQAETMSAWDTVQVCAFTALLFFSMTVQSGRMSVLLPVLALVLLIVPGAAGRLRERFCVPAIGFLGYGAACGLAAVYALHGNYAVNEYYKLLASFSVAVTALARFDRRHVRGLMWGIAAVCAVISVICTDLASGGPLFAPFNGFIETLGGSFEGTWQGGWGSQVNGIYNDANVSAGILALGALCGLHLTLTGKRRWERLLSCLLTGTDGLGLFLTASRAGILCFALALLAYLAAVGNGERTRLFFLMFLNAAAAAGIATVVTPVELGGTPVPDAAMLLCGLPVFALYEFPARWLARKLEGRGRAMAAVLALLALAVGIYGWTALRTTGPYTLTETRHLVQRVVELEPGDYTLSFVSSGKVSVFVEPCVDFEHLVWFDGTEDVNEVPFTVAEGGMIQITISGDPGETVEWARLSDGTEVPLGYPLLPDFLMDRLQRGLDAEGSVSARLQYDKDGWELFRQKPLLGWGMGGTEGALTSVQPYYYESLFLHNHVLQVMCDCGLLGAVPFLAFLLGSAWLLLRRLWESRKEGGDPLAAALLGCWVMANAHGLMELNFSIRAYQCEAFTVLLLPVVLYGKPLAPQSKEKARRICGYAFAGALCVYLGVFAFGLERHRTVEREMRGFSTGSAEAFMEQTRRWIRMDWFDQEQNKLNFVGNAVILGDSQYEEDMVRYAADLRRTGTYGACTGLAEYYYRPLGQLEEVFACTREAVAREASSSDAWNQQVSYYRDDLLPGISAEDAGGYLDGVLALADYLEEYSQGRQEEIELTEENRAFLDRARNARESGMEGAAALLYLTLPMEAESGPV